MAWEEEVGAEGLGQLAECMPSTHQALGSV